MENSPQIARIKGLLLNNILHHISMIEVDNLSSRCFETEVNGQSLHIRMLGVTQKCLELRTDWYLFALNGHKGPFTHITIDLAAYSTVNSAFVAGAIELRNRYFATPNQKIHLVNTNERVAGLVKIMNLYSFFTVDFDENA